MPTLLHLWRTRPYRCVLFLSAGLYVYLALYWFVPEALTLWGERELLAQQQAQLGQAADWQETERRARARVDQLNAHLSKARSAAVAADGLQGALAPLVLAADSSGLEITGMTTEVPVEEKGRTRWPIHLQAAGTYHQVGRFVDRIERDAALMVIDRLELAAPDMDDPEVTVQVDIVRFQWKRVQGKP